MTPEEHDSSKLAAGDEPVVAHADAFTPGSHDEVILQAAQTAAREIRHARRARYVRAGLRAVFVMAVLMLALGAHCVLPAVTSGDSALIR